MVIQMYSKETIFEDDTCYVAVQVLEGVVNLHCEVYDWKPSVLKRLYSIFLEIKDYYAGEGFKYLSTVSPNPKFAKLFGGETINELVIDGKEYEVIVWEL